MENEAKTSEQVQHTVKAPFLRSKFCNYAEDAIQETWVPGVAYRQISADDAEAYCNGEGAMILTEVSRHKPGRFPERVFFTREWVAPDGSRFGKPALRMCTAEKFRRITKGWAVDYKVRPNEAQHV